MCLPTTEKDNLFPYMLYVLNQNLKLVHKAYFYILLVFDGYTIVVLVVVYIIQTERKQRMLDSWDEIIEDENENDVNED